MPLNGEMTPELNNCTALGMPVDMHYKVRPMLCEMFGPKSTRWSKEMVKERVDAFFHHRAKIDAANDFRYFNCMLLHKVGLDMELDEEEAAEYMALQKKCIILNGFPTSVVTNPAMRKVLGYQKAFDARQAWLDKYIVKIKEVYPHMVCNNIIFFSICESVG